METWRYTAATPDGRRLEGTEAAESADALEALLAARGLIPVECTRVGAAATARRAVGARELHLFTREMHILLKSGLPLTECLHALEERGGAAGSGVARLLPDLRARMAAGESFSAALAAHPDVFPPLYRSSVRAGEASGNLLPILGRLGDHLRRAYRLREKVARALAYPAVLALLAAAVLAFLVFYVVPVFRMVFADLKLDLPLHTRLFMDAAGFVHDRAASLAALLAALLLLLLSAPARGGIRAFARGAARRMPVTGPVIAAAETARFASTLSLLLAGGIPVVESLRVLRDAADRPELPEKLDRTIRLLSEGRTLSRALQETGLFDPMAVRLCHVGERAGSLPAMLDAAAEFHEESVDQGIDLLASLAEPLLVGAMGIVVATIVVSIFLPVVRMSTAF